MPETPHGIVYPDSSGHTRLWEHLETLATSVDDAIGSDEWQTFTPALYTSSAPTTPVPSTPGVSEFRIVGRNLCIAHGEVTATGAVVSALVDLPYPMKARQIAIGSCGAWGAGAPADQTFQAYAFNTTQLVVAVAPTQAYRNLAAGNIVRYHVMYHV